MDKPKTGFFAAFKGKPKPPPLPPHEPKTVVTQSVPTSTGSVNRTLPLRALLAQVGKLDPGMPVRAFDERGHTWNLIAAVPTTRGVLALQIRPSASNEPDPFGLIDAAIADRLSADLEALSHAYKVLEAERNHWLEQVQIAERKLKTIHKIITGT